MGGRLSAELVAYLGSLSAELLGSAPKRTDELCLTAPISVSASTTPRFSHALGHSAEATHCGYCSCADTSLSSSRGNPIDALPAADVSARASSVHVAGPEGLALQRSASISAAAAAGADPKPQPSLGLGSAAASSTGTNDDRSISESAVRDSAAWTRQPTSIVLRLGACVILLVEPSANVLALNIFFLPSSDADGTADFAISDGARTLRQFRRRLHLNSFLYDMAIRHVHAKVAAAAAAPSGVPVSDKPSVPPSPLRLRSALATPSYLGQTTLPRLLV
jgi:hypothetical protein